MTLFHVFPPFPASVAISPWGQKTQMERSVLCTMPTGQREHVPLSPAVPRRQGTHSALAASGSSPAGHRAQIPSAPAKPGAHGSQRVRAVLGSVPPAHKEQNPWVPAVPGGQSKHVVESADVCWPSPQAWHIPPVPAKPWRHVIHSVWSTVGSVLSGHATHTSEPCRVEAVFPVHSSQLVCLELGWAKPLGHFWHEICPGSSWNSPGKQSLQIAPSPACPAPHWTHSVPVLRVPGEQTSLHEPPTPAVPGLQASHWLKELGQEPSAHSVSFGQASISVPCRIAQWNVST